MAYLRDAFLKVRKTIFGSSPELIDEKTRAFSRSLDTYNVYPCAPWTTDAYTKIPDEDVSRELFANWKIDLERSFCSDGMTLLMDVAKQGFSTLASEMIEKGARVGAKDADDENAIHAAVRGFRGIASWWSPTRYNIGEVMPDLKTVAVLADAATLEELTQKNKSGHTPLDVLRAKEVYGQYEENKNKIADLLVQKIAEKEAAAKAAPVKPAAKSTAHKRNM